MDRVYEAILAKKDFIDFTGYEDIPETTKQSIQNFFLHGIPPGDFLQGVIKGDITSIMRADKGNERALKSIVMFMYNEVPAPWFNCSNAVNAVLDAHKESKLVV